MKGGTASPHTYIIRKLHKLIVTKLLNLQKIRKNP